MNINLGAGLELTVLEFEQRPTLTAVSNEIDAAHARVQLDPNNAKRRDRIPLADYVDITLMVNVAMNYRYFEVLANSPSLDSGRKVERVSAPVAQHQKSIG